MDRERSWSAGIILLVTALVIAFGLGGCQAIDRFVSMKNDFKVKETGIAKTQPGTPGGQVDAVGVQARVENPIPPGQEQILTLYFADPKGQNLVAEKRAILKTDSVARAAVQQLIKGPSVQSKALPTIPSGTRLLDIAVKNGICTVNLSKEFQKNHQGGSSSETLTVYSLVNTLTHFPSIQKVQLLVEGKKIESLAGHMDVSQAMARKNSMIINEPNGTTNAQASAPQAPSGSNQNAKQPSSGTIAQPGQNQ